MILANLWRRKTRTLLTVLGIAVGVAAVVAMPSTVRRVRVLRRHKFLRIMPRLFVPHNRT